MNANTDEITVLRSEQVERIKQRDSFVNLAIVSIGVMVSAAFTGSPPHAEILLAIPWVTLAFGWSFILNDVKVARLGSYFEASETNRAGWESWRRRVGRSWLEQPFVGALVQTLVFLVPGIVSLIVYFRIRVPKPVKPLEVAAALGGGLLSLALACAIVTAARLRRPVSRKIQRSLRSVARK